MREVLPLIHLRSDVERKRLFGFAAEERTGSPTDGGIYTSEASARTYDRLRELAGMILGCGYDVLVDATFLRREQRQVFRALAAARGAGFALLVLEAPIQVLRARVSDRLAAGADPSEAGLAVLEQQFRGQEALDASERSQALVIDTTHPPAMQDLLAGGGQTPGGGPEGRALLASAPAPGGDPQAQGVEADEAGGVALVVGTGVLLEGGDAGVEQAVGF